jgi:hypothetical protein
MSFLANRVKTISTSTGTGGFSFGTPADGFYSPQEAGIPGSTIVRYVIEDGNDFEIGTGLLSSGQTHISNRTPEETLVSGTADRTSPTAITLSGNQTIMVVGSAKNFSHQTALSFIYGV